MKTTILAFLFINLALFTFNPPAQAEAYECDISLQSLENFNGEPNINEILNSTFGGLNSVEVLKKQNGIQYATISNKNGADDLQVLIMFNYMKELWTFIGATLVGPVQGQLYSCRSK